MVRGSRRQRWRQRAIQIAASASSAARFSPGEQARR